ncbi:hypothetical protein M406DRAFT_278747 [Cryphonectria parasitica EP155]|uniref:DUF7728 domain-containing protein n=1 Tax=Cryphonectria parasitica (strain ATCC 38755 / EP155) TaxID=660469 RepID=A0A9P5CPD4_CRYP1|nr:uncharacterized protein M406DRAFT_278747 [Cryphonectria parasitica EP155]KAF3765051.1 hypothetical protein M406DRAFT_278747 [Cryphonectria parasitica EP155]
MLLRPLIAVAGLSAAASAFLLPPQVSSHEVDTMGSVPIEIVPAAHAKTVHLECAGCPPVLKHKNHNKHKGTQHKQHVSHLELDFKTESGKLMVNGFELYPHSDPFSNVLVAAQVAEKPKHHNKHNNKQHHSKDGDKGKELKSHHKFRPHEDRPKSVQQQLGFSLQIQPVIKTADELELFTVDLQIIEVGSVFVDGLPNIRVDLIKAPSHELMIAKIEKTASETTPTTIADGQKECTTILCKWRAIIAAQLEKMKTHGCTGLMGIKAGGHGGAHAHGGHHGHHVGHMGHNRQHGWALLFRKLTSHIILPILVGIVAGVSVSILGMLVGTILVGLWRKFVRGQSFFPTHHCRRFGRSSHHKTIHQEAALPEEKASLMAMSTEDLPPPPSYEDEPATEHVERV